MEAFQEAIQKYPIIPNGKDEYHGIANDALEVYDKYKDHDTPSDIQQKAYDGIIKAKELYVHEFYAGLEVKTVSPSQVFEFLWVMVDEDLVKLQEIIANILPNLENLEKLSYTSRFVSDMEYSCFTTQPSKLTTLELTHLNKVNAQFISDIDNLILHYLYGPFEDIPKSLKRLTIYYWDEMAHPTDTPKEIEELRIFAQQFPNLEYLEVNGSEIPLDHDNPIK